MSVDPHSQTWMAIKEWAEARQAEHLRELRNGGDQDDKHRGAMDELDALLQLETPAEIPTIAQRAKSPDRA